ncbi:RNA polymerase sigma factor [Sphingomonas flavescens]|uniref:RNA polymerase sigma factor n=1 Tax=Sphingomonas flavescens TaxID=3132797 RepID=UPI0028038167|nr:RNA polymerase sigma factor [Sphingomonas limnosediminicola]
MQSGLEQVLAANQAKVMRFLRARLGDPNEAEDCLQDLWIKLRALEAGPIADPLPYLLTLARNLALDRRRSTHYRERREGAWLAVHLAASNAADDAPSAEQILIGKERLQRVRAVLDQLPERTAAIIRQYRLEGRPQKAIAQEFGISLSAVEKHLQRAYRALIEARETLDAELDDRQRPSSERETRVGKV